MSSKEALDFKTVTIEDARLKSSYVLYKQLRVELSFLVTSEMRGDGTAQVTEQFKDEALRIINRYPQP